MIGVAGYLRATLMTSPTVRLSTEQSFCRGLDRQIGSGIRPGGVSRRTRRIQEQQDRYGESHPRDVPSTRLRNLLASLQMRLTDELVRSEAPPIAPSRVHQPLALDRKEVTRVRHPKRQSRLAFSFARGPRSRFEGTHFGRDRERRRTSQSEEAPPVRPSWTIRRPRTVRVPEAWQRLRAPRTEPGSNSPNGSVQRSAAARERSS